MVKTFEELTIEDKIMLINFLFPKECRSFLEYTKWTLSLILEKPEERIIPHCPRIEGLNWIKVTQVLLEHINSNIEQLAENKAAFLNTFSERNNKHLFLRCIRHYRCESNNMDYQNAIGFFFPY